jgi:hypothetical protein
MVKINIFSQLFAFEYTNSFENDMNPFEGESTLNNPFSGVTLQFS